METFKIKNGESDRSFKDCKVVIGYEEDGTFDITRCSFEGCVIVYEREIALKSVERMCEFELRECRFEGCVIEYNNISCHYSDCEFERLGIEGRVMRNVGFDRCRFHDGVVTDSMFKTVSFISCEFEGVRVESIGYVRGFVMDSRFKGCTFISDVIGGMVSMKRCEYEENCNFYECADLCVSRCPSSGSFTGWKKVQDNDGNPCIAKLLIPEDAERISGFGGKCRASKAVVLGIYKVGSDEEVKERCHSIFDKNFWYVVGNSVKCEKAFDKDCKKECGSGIHFYLNRLEAEMHETFGSLYSKSYVDKILSLKNC